MVTKSSPTSASGLVAPVPICRQEARAADATPPGENSDLSTPSYTPRYGLRIVIQQIFKAGKASFRLAAYGGNRAPGHSDFDTLDALLKALHRAVPGFDDSGVSIKVAGGNQTSIIFAGEMELDDNQLSILGLS
jgi:hypothetical protein